MKKFLILLTLCLGLLPGTAAAHVLISDESRPIGAILHITPDDDPIAGEQSSIAFTMEGRAVSKKTHAFTLQVIDDQERAVYVPIQVNDSTATATYTFPRQGAYEIVLSAEAVNGTSPTLTFRQSQRVARGEKAATSIVSTPFWAQFGVIAALIALLVIMMTVFNRRKTLLAYAKAQKF
ncbi:MAG TPA: hypothetical protein VF733_06315 [Candidatus Saccharimonadales bacterium]